MASRRCGGGRSQDYAGLLLGDLGPPSSGPLDPDDPATWSWLEEVEVTFFERADASHCVSATSGSIIAAVHPNFVHESDVHWATYRSSADRRLIKTPCAHMGSCQHHDSANPDDRRVHVTRRVVVVEVDTPDHGTAIFEEGRYLEIVGTARRLLEVAGLPPFNLSYSSPSGGPRFVWVIHDATDAEVYEAHCLGLRQRLAKLLDPELPEGCAVDEKTPDWTRLWRACNVTRAEGTVVKRPVEVWHRDVICIEDLPCGEAPRVESAVTDLLAQVRIAMAPAGERVRRARAYLAQVPPAVSGEAGHNQTYKAAMALHGFGLDRENALDLLSEWNEDCIPPWSETDLQHKIDSAWANADEPHGHLLGNGRVEESENRGDPDVEGILRRMDAGGGAPIESAADDVESISLAEAKALRARLDDLINEKRSTEELSRAPHEIRRPRGYRRQTTPWDELNCATRGGVQPGDNICMAGITSAGKSLVAMWFCAWALVEGLNVLYVDFEQRAWDLLLGLVAALAGPESQGLTADWDDDRDIRSAAEYLEQRHGLGIFRVLALHKHVPDVSATDVAQMVAASEARHEVKYDLVVCDYFDHLFDANIFSSAGGQWVMEKRMIKQFQAWLESEGKIGLTLLQAGKGGMSKVSKGETIDMEDLGGSVGKPQLLHYVWLIHRLREGGLILELAKAREGGWLVGSKVSYGYARSFGTRGYLTMGSWTAPLSPKKVWDESEEILMECLRGESDRMKALVIEDRDHNKVKWRGHRGISLKDLKVWFGKDQKCLDYALEKMREKGLIEAEEKCRFAGQNERKYVIFKRAEDLP